MDETLKRALSGAVYIILLVASILYSTESFFLLFGIFLLIAIYEFSSLVHLNKILPLFFGLIVFLSISALVLFKEDLKKYLNFTLSDHNYDINQCTSIIKTATLIISLLVALKGILFLFNDYAKVDSYNRWLYLFGYLIFPMTIITYIPFGVKGYNPKIIISIFIIIWTNDTFAYLVGKSVGKHKLFERISPKKTIEGFIGGVLFAIVAGFLISKFYIRPNEKFFQRSVTIWIMIALIVSIFGTTGDLIESKFKRLAGVKDSGKLMPGHGGILDRLDSVIFAAPFVFLFYQILNYVTFS